MRPPERPRAYSLQFAETVVSRFLEDYARASYFLAKELKIDSQAWNNMLINKFAFENPAWNRIRDTIKKVSKHHLLPKDGLVSPQQRLNYLTSVTSLEEKDIYL